MMKFTCDVCDEEIDGEFITITMDGQFLAEGTDGVEYIFHVCGWECMAKLSIHMSGDEVEVVEEVEEVPNEEPEEEPEETRKIVIRKDSSTHGGIKMGHRDMDKYTQPSYESEFGGIRKR